MFQLLKLKDASCTQAADIAKRKITSIQDELGHKISPETVANALAQGFKAILKIQLEEGELTPSELETANKLYKEKYSTKEWNLGGKTLSFLFMPPYALRCILKHDAHRFKLGSYGVGFFPVFGFAGFLTLLHQRINVCSGNASSTSTLPITPQIPAVVTSIIKTRQLSRLLSCSTMLESSKLLISRTKSNSDANAMPIFKSSSIEPPKHALALHLKLRLFLRFPCHQYHVSV